MSETETRMSRYHGKDKHRREYEDYVKGGASQESKQADWPSLENQDRREIGRASCRERV